MRTTVFRAVVCALVCVAGTIGWAQQPGFSQADYDRLKQQVIADAAKKKAARDNLLYSIDMNRRKAAYYFGESARLKGVAAQADANAAEIQSRIDARRPYMIQVQPMSKGWYWVQPIR
jgi:hypothetical protein